MPTLDLPSLYAASGGMSAHGPIKMDGYTVGAADQHGSRTVFRDQNGKTVGYAEQGTDGRVTLRAPDGRTIARYGR